MKAQPKFKKLYGTLIPSRERVFEDLSLLTPQGEMVKISKNSKFDKIRTLLFEPVKIIGRVVRRGSVSVLDILYVSKDADIPAPLTADFPEHPMVHTHPTDFDRL